MDQLSLVMQSLEFYPTQLELKEIIRQYDRRGVTFPDFLEIMAGLAQRNLNTEILEAFQAYDEAGTGTIHIRDLKRILQTTGQKLSSADIKHAMELAGAGTAEIIHYRDFVGKIVEATKQNGHHQDSLRTRTKKR
ncbi:Calmodulin [Trichoplax sp. H2]|nr:Calmodulin [Trichoplax sp. H2]|eukprot:RDD47625.1 Calmodulin [Trichoplax sp. H2]